MPRWSPFDEYFWSLVEKTDGCWNWKGGTYGNGYGRIRVGNKATPAHRVAYELLKEKIPPKLFACHRCDNKLCVNPAHIFIGTQKDNMQDWTKKGKNRLANNKNLWSNGKHMKGKKGEKYRTRLSKQRKLEFKTGKRIPIRDVKGRVMGTRMVAQ